MSPSLLIGRTEKRQQEILVQKNCSLNPPLDQPLPQLSTSSDYLYLCSSLLPASSGSRGSRGGHAPPPPGRVKISYKKDGHKRQPHRFHVSHPPPYQATGSATDQHCHCFSIRCLFLTNSVYSFGSTYNMVKLIYAVLCYDNIPKQGGLPSGWLAGNKY